MGGGTGSGGTISGGVVIKRKYMPHLKMTKRMQENYDSGECRNCVGMIFGKLVPPLRIALTIVGFS